MNQDQITGLRDRLGELLHHFHPEACAEYSPEELAAITEMFLTEAATQEWVAGQMDQMKLKAMDFRDGVKMELEPAREMAASLVAAARTLLAGGENYSETVYIEPEDADRATYSMDVSIPELPERYTLTVQRVAPGKLTPHEARRRAEAAIAATWDWIGDVNNGAGYDTGDLAFTLERSGFPPPPDEEA